MLLERLLLYLNINIMHPSLFAIYVLCRFGNRPLLPVGDVDEKDIFLSTVLQNTT
jgi:hypothetical protein